MNKKGFILSDALVNVLIVSLLCALCFSIFRLIDKNEEVYNCYLETSNEKYDTLFGSLEICEICVVEETEESFLPEPY